MLFDSNALKPSTLPLDKQNPFELEKNLGKRDTTNEEVHYTDHATPIGRGTGNKFAHGTPIGVLK
jgi:hypothetical protein